MRTNRSTRALLGKRLSRVRRRLNRAGAEAKRLAMLGGCFEFYVPTLGAFVDGINRRISLVIQADSESAALNDDLAAYAVRELRRVAIELTCAADRIEASEGGVP